MLMRAVIAALALHLGNTRSERYDVVSLGILAIRKSSPHWHDQESRLDPTLSCAEI